MRDSAAKLPRRDRAGEKDVASLVTRTPEPDREGHTEQVNLHTFTPAADGVSSRAYSAIGNSAARRHCSRSVVGAVSETLSWNAYPWYINRLPRAAELEAGTEPQRQLLGLLPLLRVVMLHGGSARDGWRRLARRHPGLVSRIEVVTTYHTSHRAARSPGSTHGSA